jgi:Cu2+-containing amine oxidase
MIPLRRRSAVLSFGLLLAAAMARPQDKPLPLDPLTAQEREVATSVARADPRIREFMGNRRARQIYVDFIAVKESRRPDEQNEAPEHRYAEALFYRYDDNLGLRALVDLEARKVVDIARVRGESVPINTEEVEEAARLAQADERVARLFGGKMPEFQVATQPATAEDINANRIEGLRTLGMSPKDPCQRNRCIVLFFRMQNRYVHMNQVIVDLTSRTVRVRGGAR